MIGLALLLAATAGAHGPPPAPVGVASFDVDGPVHIPLTEGMAVREAEGWRYVCPTRWGSVPESPSSALPAGDALALVPGEADLYRLDGSLASGMGAAELRAVELASWAAAEDGTAWALTYGEDGARPMWRMDAPERVWQSEGSWSSVSPQGEDLLVAALLEGDLTVATVARDGSERERVVWASEQEGYTPAVRQAHEPWLIERASGEHRLLRWTGAQLELVATGSEEILGPVPHPDGVDLVAIDTWLSPVEQAGAGSGREGVSCLVRRGDQVWACVAPALHPVQADGSLGPPITPLDGLLAPRYDGLSAEEEANCLDEWIRIAGDLGIDPFDTEQESGQPPPEESGLHTGSPDKRCGCASPAPPALAWMLALGVVVARRRGRPA